MKYFFKFLCPIVALMLLQSCEKKDKDDDLQIDHFPYGAKFNWQEDSIKTGNGDWAKVAKGICFHGWLKAAP